MRHPGKASDQVRKSARLPPLSARKLSKTALSQLGERLWEDYQAFTKRDLSEYEITTYSLTALLSGYVPAPNASLY